MTGLWYIELPHRSFPFLVNSISVAAINTARRPLWLSSYLNLAMTSLGLSLCLLLAKYSPAVEPNQIVCAVGQGIVFAVFGNIRKRNFWCRTNDTELYFFVLLSLFFLALCWHFLYWRFAKVKLNGKWWNGALQLKEPNGIQQNIYKEFREGVYLFPITFHKH